MTDLQKRYFDARLRVVFQALESVCNEIYEVEGQSENVELMHSALQFLQGLLRNMQPNVEGGLNT